MQIVEAPEDTEEESGTAAKVVGKATLLTNDILKTRY